MTVYIHVAILKNTTKKSVIFFIFCRNRLFCPPNSAIIALKNFKERKLSR